MKFWREIKFLREDIEGGITLALVIIAIAVILLLNKIHNDKERSDELNGRSSIQHTQLSLRSDGGEPMAEYRPKTQPHSNEPMELFEFDPNTVRLKELLSLGFSKSQAVSLLKYRAAGKVFHIPEELIETRGISDSLYFIIEPYIVIGEEFRYKVRDYSSTKNRAPNITPNRDFSARSIAAHRLQPSSFLIDTVGVRYLTAIGALSTRQAEVFVKWRDMSGIESIEELKSCYTVSDSIANWLAQYAIFSPKADLQSKLKSSAKSDEVSEVSNELSSKRRVTELNSADSTALVAIYGIGATSAAAIIEYRRRLGGFHSKEQLTEIKIITETNFEKIIEQISINYSDISKIDVNFATAKQLSQHPYFTSLKIRRLLKIRELKGGWRSTEEMIEDDIFTKEEAQRVHPYLHFEVLDPL